MTELEQVRQESEESFLAIQQTLQKKADDLKYYHDYWSTNLKSNLIYWATQQLLSLHKEDDMSVEFDWSYLIQDIIDNLNTSAKSDYDDMWMQEIELAAEKDRILLWVWIIVDSWFDEFWVRPIPKCIDPLCRRPDPYCRNNEQQARYHWFMMSMSLLEAKNDTTLDQKMVQKIYDSKMADIEKNNRDMWNAQDQVQVSQILWSQITLYYHYYHNMSQWGKKWLTVTDPWCSMILKSEPIKQTKQDEKNWVSYFPINIRRFSPQRWMPMWLSLIDLLREPQKAKDFFLSLKRLKAAKEAMWWDIVVDVDSWISPLAFKDQNNLAPRIHWVSLRGKQIDQIIYQVPQTKPTSEIIDSTNQDIDLQSSISTGISPQSMWVPADKNMTARESQTVQMNSNIRLWLWATYLLQAKRRFWDIIRYRSLVINFASSDKKQVLINNWIYWADQIFTRSDLITSIKPKIHIISKAQADQNNQKLLLTYEVMYQSAKQDPSLSEFSKRMIERKIWKLKWASKEEIDVFTISANPKILADELNAKEHMILINAWEVPQMQADEDHAMYLMYYLRCEEWPAKQKALAKRRQLATLIWEKVIEDPVQNWWMANAVGNIAVSQMASQQQNILPPKL